MAILFEVNLLVYVQRDSLFVGRTRHCHATPAHYSAYTAIMRSRCRALLWPLCSARPVHPIRRAHSAHRATSWLGPRRFTPRMKVLDEAAESVVRVKSLALELDARRG